MNNCIRLENLVAEHVMGWELLEVNYVGTPEETQRQKELEDWMDKNKLKSVGLYWIDVEKDFWISAIGYLGWRPTEKIGQAWSVLEKFPDSEYLIDITRINDDFWSIKIDNRKERLYPWHADKNICVAICLAALYAKEIEYEHRD